MSMITPTAVLRRFVLPLALVALSMTAARADDPDLWPDLRSQIFGKVDIAEEDGVVSLEAPVRAEDAALVPMTIKLAPATAATVKKVTFIIDQNPSPVVATFAFGDAAGEGERHITTRVRVDRYTFVRAIAETADGRLHMAAKFVKASGGCSAPASKDMEAALAGIGKMQISSTAPKAGVAEAQVMIRHPNFTGLQMDEILRSFTPARFVQEMEVRRGGDLIFRMDGGISISENPHFRFTYAAKANSPIEVTAKDSEGAEFKGSYQPSGS